MRLNVKTLLICLLLVVLGSIALAQSVSFGIKPASLKPGEKGTFTATLAIPKGMHQSYMPDYFTLQAEHPSLQFSAVVYPKTNHKGVDGSPEYVGSVTLSLPFTVKAAAKPGKLQVKGTMSYNICKDSGECLPPEDVEGSVNLTIAEAAKTELDAAKPAVTEQDVPDPDTPVASPDTLGQDSTNVTATSAGSGTPAESAPSDPQSKGMGKMLKYMLFALLGGLILNITPCVLPILPIRIMSIINQAQKDRSKVLAHTLVYAVGVLVSFAILAGVFIALRVAGEQQGWGFQNQNPVYTLVMLSIVFVFALSLLGVFVLTAPGMGTATRATAKKGYAGSFFGGIFAFLMAISCTGPFLGAALPFALELPSPLLMLFFLLIGLGFALPFIIIGIFPKALAIIPKPGEWMNIFKEVMGFVLLYLVYTMVKTLLALTGGVYLMHVLMYLLALGFALWMYGRFVRVENSKATQWIFTVLALAVILFAIFTWLPLKDEYYESNATAVQTVDGMTPAPHAPQGWYVFSPALLDSLLAQGKPVFLDIGAAWCKNCATNEATVLFKEKTMQDFAAKGVVLLRGDFTRKDDVLLAWMQKHQRSGVPFNALYIPGKDPILFPELISGKHIRDALAQIP